MKEKEVIIKALDKLGVALAEHNHKWTVEERELYKRSITLLTAPVVG
jgi:hypothetical protein